MTARRWSGRARVDGGRVARLRLEVAGVATSAWIGPRALVVQASAGPIAIDLSSDALTMSPEVERSGAWQDLESDPRAQPFKLRAPGPHVHVKLTESVIEDGDALAVEGTLAQGDARVHATVIAVGANALDALERANPSPEMEARRHVRTRPPLWIAFACALVAVGVASVARSIPYSPATLDLGALAVVVLAWGLHRAARTALVFRAAAGRLDARPWGSKFHVPIGIALLLLASLGIGGDWPGHMYDGRQENGSSLALAAWSIYLACLLIDLFRSGRHSSRIARVMLAAPRTRTDQWGAVAGTVHTRTERAAVYSLIEEEWREGSGSNARIESQYQAPFTIAPTASRAAVRVEPKNQACWATDEVEHTRKSASPREEKVVIERTEIVEGTRVLAVGRMHMLNDSAVLEPTGAESLLVYASARDNPRTVLISRVALRAFAMLFLFAAIVSGAALAYFHPGMPPENIPDTN